MARKNGIVDIIRVPSGDEQEQAGELLGTVREERMRVGVERWVGLQLTKTYVDGTYRSGLVSCTSGGFFRYVPLTELLNGETTPEAWASSAITWTVPSPLHHVAFYPPRSDTPTHFAYGGEQVPLSIWSLAKALESAQQPVQPEPSEEPSSGHTGSKRSASSKSSKGRGLLPGELWRAKNLPNDHLSLPRPPLIRTLAFAPTDAVADDELKGMRIYAGTKDGIVRVYDPAQKPRPIHEWQVGAKEQGSLRVLHLCASEQILLAGDTSRRLSAVDLSTGRVLFQYKDITGTLSDVLTVQDAQAQRTLVLSASLDHLVRLCDLGEPYGERQRRRGQVLEQYFTGADHAVALALDPHQSPAPVEEASDDEEGVWDTMAVVGEKVSETSAPDDDDDDDDSDAARADARRAEKRHRRDP